MTPLVPIALYGWLPISLILFRELRGHRGLICCYVVGTLLLPEHTIPVGGFPDYSKAAAMAYGAIGAALIFDAKTFFRFRLHPIDLPILAFCLIPIPSALTNNLSLMDGVNVACLAIIGWGIPYLLGRMYLTSFESIRSAAYGIFLGGVFYVPFCLYEIRMSPQLNKMVYGFQYGTWSVVRFGGFRPNVFLKTGLDLGLWMTAATLLGLFLFRFKIVKKVYGIKVQYLLAALMVTTVLCKATGALLLLIGGTALIYLWQKTRWRGPLLLLVLVPAFYISVRTSRIYDFSHAVAAARSVFGTERANSLQFRFKNEDILIDRALEAPILGWTGYGRNRVLNEYGVDKTVTDGYWIILLGTCGIVGLAAFYSALLVIPALSIIRFSSRRYKLYDVGAIVALSVFTVILSIDCLLNAFWTTVYPLYLGGLATVYLKSDSKLLDDEICLENFNELETGLQKRLWPPPNREQQPQLTT